MTRLRPRTTRAAVAGLVVVAALALTGCSSTNPITTKADYDASDGMGVRVGDVRAHNLLVVAAEEGGPGVLSGALANSGSETEDVTIGIGDDDPVEVSVPAGGTVLLGVTDAPARYTTADVRVSAVPAPPGGLADVRLTTSRAGTVDVRVSVLDGTLPEYVALLDSLSGVTPSPQATRDASEPQEEEAEPEVE